MILQDVHVEMLSGLQRKIESNRGSSYICVLLEYAILERFQVDAFEDSQEAMQTYEEMTAAIREALSYYSTVFIYLHNVVPGFHKLDEVTKENFAALARIAWLDKMIESRTIT